MSRRAVAAMVAAKFALAACAAEAPTPSPTEVFFPDRCALEGYWVVSDVVGP
jgi:nitrous oxide reductase accessory protein NosL